MFQPRRRYASPSATPVATLYKKGAIVSGWKQEGTGGGGKRGIVGDASGKSLRRASFFLENSAARWSWMTTLTFRVEHANPKGCLRQWMSYFPCFSSQRYDWAWFMEFQQRGVVHFHVFWGADCVAAVGLLWGYHYTPRRRHGRLVDIVCGEAADCIADGWISVVGDSSPEFDAFQRGGITEVFATEDGPGRYMAKYAAKKEQKVLPEGQEPLGRWWYISAHAMPVPCGTVPITRYPFDKPLSLIYNKTDVV